MLKQNISLFKKKLYKIRNSIVVGPFNHARAQKYEMGFANKMIRDHFQRLQSKFETKIKNNEFYHNSDNQFFGKNDSLWNEFIAKTTGKTALEIGSGPFGFLCFATWPKERHIIDPLINSYREAHLKNFNTTLFTKDIKTHSISAETFVPELKGKIDGFIVCRNCIDHTEDPWKILYNISQYAAVGSYLLFWADIWHIDGANEGHRNVTKDGQVIEAFLLGQGYKIISRHHNQGGHDNTLDYGCLAIKEH